MKVLSLAAVVALVVSQGVFAEEAVLAEEAGWDSSIAIGVNGTSGNSDTIAINASVTAERIGDVHETRLGIEGNYGESELDGVDETTTQNAKASANYKYRFNGSYVYSDNSLAHDDIAAIDYRLIVGGGFGYYVFETDAAKIGVEAGVAYFSEELADGTSDDGALLRVALRHDQTLSENAKLWWSAEYLPRGDDFDDYLFNAEAGAEASLNSALALRIVVQDRYDSIVPVDRERNDVSVISALVCKL
jgi:putative salt-induced outer membrane protein YdiY